ncbi:MAG: ABC transporter ATP-binding protein [Propionibacteriaceae bacterium]|jgi:ABC-2 type transport system ATP-binding protein|nr:ABC transporter ATP-binding protein [Propionibacteriaceae bacterium]
MIELDGLTKVFGAKTAVDHLSFTVQPGRVTGFLGPNGAGKSTTMRLIAGLDRPTAGRATVNGRSFADCRAPLHEVGLLLDAKAVHPARSARNHLRVLAATHGLPQSRVDEVIELTGLGAVADKKAGQFSLGMGQRLGLAAALLGDPATFILDEPVNGLDPEGVHWIRNLTRQWAAEGRTVLVSSHLMSEMAMTADHLLVLGQGRLLADQPMADFIAQASGAVTRVRSPQAADIAAVLAGPDVTLRAVERDVLKIEGLDSAAVGEIAARRGWVLYENTPLTTSLEDAFLELTESATEYRAQAVAV